MSFSYLTAQSRTYTGTVTGADDGQALIGVNVTVVGPETGDFTGTDGSFSITASPGDSIAISYIGYKDKGMRLGSATELSVVLELDSRQIDEVVVIGYGTIKKSDLTGSVSSVKSADIRKVPTTNPINALQGKVAGLQILNSSGEPGSNPVVRLRGITTLNDNSPIAVIDGVITDISAIALLNANDIESMEVLKDASASAIYGSRGASGVVVVTTKRGTAGAPRINLSVERSVENIANTIDVMTGREFATYLNAVNPGTFNNLDILPETDWQSLIFQENATITSANASVSGGSERARYYFGLGYFGQEGILPKSGLDRLTAKLNTSFDVSNSITVGLDIAALYTDKENAPGVINTALRAWPIDEPFEADGVTYAEVEGGNPLAAIEFSNSSNKRLSSLGNLYIDIDFLKNFRFRSSLQFDLGYSRNRNFTPEFFVSPLQQNEINNLSYNTGHASTLIYENTLNYQIENGNHTVSALVGYTAQDSRNEFINGFTEGLIREDPLFWYLNAGQDDLDRVSNSFGRSTLISYLGRVNYSFAGKYLFTASIRRDGSSKFGANNRYGNFPSFAVGWNMYNEPFFPQGGILNRVKVRASWGIIGNERIPGDAQYALISSGTSAVFGEGETIQPGATFNGGGNPNLRWEETTQSNIGVDLGFFQDKLTAEFDYYVKQTDDILVPLEPIGYTGIGAFRSIFFNAASVENKGFEWNVNYRNRAGDFTYQIGILGSTISNTVTDIGQDIGADSLLIGGDLGNGQRVSRTAVGQPIGYFYGYDVEGVFQSDAEAESLPSLFGQRAGDLRYRDINGDGSITSADRTLIGSSIPDLIYGFNVSVGYKIVNVSLDFQGQRGSDIYNGKQAIRFATLNFEDKFNDYWTGEGSTNEDPRASLGGTNYLPSSYFVEDGSFFRLRTATINVSAPERLAERIGMQSANLYLRGTNLFTSTDFTGYSPEIGAASAIDGAIDRGVYPITRIITLGLTTTF